MSLNTKGSESFLINLPPIESLSVPSFHSLAHAS